MTVMGDALRDRLSDAGSTPARSTNQKEQVLTALVGTCSFYSLHMVSS